MKFIPVLITIKLILYLQCLAAVWSESSTSALRVTGASPKEHLHKFIMLNSFHAGALASSSALSVSSYDLLDSERPAAAVAVVAPSSSSIASTVPERDPGGSRVGNPLRSFSSATGPDPGDTDSSHAPAVRVPSMEADVLSDPQLPSTEGRGGMNRPFFSTQLHAQSEARFLQEVTDE